MARKLDQTDQQILTLLAENARQSVKELARRIGLSRSAAQERLARLERDGVLAGYTIRRNDRRRTGSPPISSSRPGRRYATTSPRICARSRRWWCSIPSPARPTAWWRWWPTA